MATATLDFTGEGAMYVRVSEDRQDEARQLADNQKFLKRHGQTVRPENIFTDKDWKRDEADERPDFQRMIRKAEDGRIKWIVVSEDDRFGTKSLRQGQHYLYLLNEAGCRLYTSKDEDLTSEEIGDFLQSGIRGNQSVQSLRKTAERVHSAMRQQAERGEWNGGHVPFGCDVVCFGKADMKERWRVQMIGRDMRIKISPDGTRKDYDGENNFPPREQGEVLQLRPTTNQNQLDAVRKVFETHDTQTINNNQLADFLTGCGVKPYYSDYWTHKHIERMLRNPVYVGYPTWNKNSYAKYSAWAGGRTVERRPGKNRGIINAVEDWIKPNAPLFEPIIEPALFERTQAKIAREAAIHHKSRAPRSPKLWLRGFLYCGVCGQAMQGRTESTGRPTYACSTYINTPRAGRSKCTCGLHTVDHKWAEDRLKEYLAELWPTVSEMSKPKPPAALRETIKNSIMMWTMMRRAIIEKLGPEAMNQCLGLDQNERIDELYRSIFDHNVAADTARIDQLRADYRDQTLSLARMKSDMQRQVIQEHLDSVESNIKDLTHRTTNYADLYTSARAEMNATAAAWEAAQQEIETVSSGRRKAEALKRVLSKMVVNFKNVGKKRVIQSYSIELASNISQQPTGCRAISVRRTLTL